MSRRFNNSSSDWDRRPPQPAHRRQQMHGALQPMPQPRRRLTKGDRWCLLVALFAFALIAVPGAFWLARGAPQAIERPVR